VKELARQTGETTQEIEKQIVEMQDITEISFPFKQVSFVISDGGNGAVSKFMNYHFSFSGHSRMGTNSAMIYAFDIVQLSEYGVAGWNLFPDKNEKYPIFGKEIVSPIDWNCWPD
jgi:hypothetical protein